MAAKIFNCPDWIQPPSIRVMLDQGFDKFQEQEQIFIKELQKFLKKRKPNGKKVGWIARFPVADGCAQYMIASLKPLELVHMPLGDAWNYRYIERLTSQDIQAAASEK